MDDTTSTSSAHVLKIEAEADELESKALALRAEAKRLRAESAEVGPAGMWITKDRPHPSGVTFRALLDAAARGEIRKYRAGKSPVFKVSDVDAWIEQDGHRPSSLRDAAAAAVGALAMKGRGR